MRVGASVWILVRTGVGLRLFVYLPSEVVDDVKNFVVLESVSTICAYRQVKQR